jgi:hypothetical protein
MGRLRLSRMLHGFEIQSSSMARLTRRAEALPERFPSMTMENSRDCSVWRGCLHSRFISSRLTISYNGLDLLYMIIYVYIYLYLIMFACRMPGIRYIGIIALQINFRGFHISSLERLQGLVPSGAQSWGMQKNPKDVKP